MKYMQVYIGQEVSPSFHYCSPSFTKSLNANMNALRLDLVHRVLKRVIGVFIGALGIAPRQGVSVE